MAAGRPRKPPAPLDPTADDAAEQAARLALAARLDALMRDRGLTAPALAERSGVSLSALRELVGARRAATLTLLARLAAALDLPLAGLFGTAYPQSRQAMSIPIRGGARLGVWRDMALRDEDRGAATDISPADERVRDCPRFGIDIEDDQLMGLTPPIPRGHVAIVADTRASDLALESGRVYLVHLLQGGLVATSFRRLTLRRHPDRWEFAPLTADPARNQAETLTVPRDVLDAGETVIIGGLLVGATLRLV